MNSGAIDSTHERYSRCMRETAKTHVLQKLRNIFVFQISECVGRTIYALISLFAIFILLLLLVAVVAAVIYLCCCCCWAQIKENGTQTAECLFPYQWNGLRVECNRFAHYSVSTVKQRTIINHFNCWIKLFAIIVSLPLFWLI